MLKLLMAQIWCSRTSGAGDELLRGIHRPSSHLQQGRTSAESSALQEEAKRYRYPTVDLFLAWVRARISVSFRRLDQPKVELHLPVVVCCLQIC